MADNGNNVLDGLYSLAKSIPNKKAQAKAYLTTIIGVIASATTAAWADITGKPITFPPDTHTHVEADITDLGTYVTVADLAPYALTVNVPVISNDAYSSGTWNNNTDGASKDAIRDKIESMTLGTGSTDVLLVQVYS
jgi:hypothetical protein